MFNPIHNYDMLKLLNRIQIEMEQVPMRGTYTTMWTSEDSRRLSDCIPCHSIPMEAIQFQFQRNEASFSSRERFAAQHTHLASEDSRRLCDCIQCHSIPMEAIQFPFQKNEASFSSRDRFAVQCTHLASEDLIVSPILLNNVQSNT